MQLGIKIGPEDWSSRVISDLGIRCVEVYFDLQRKKEYAPMFAHLQTNGIIAGLHASSLLDDGTVPNLVTADGRVRRASVSLFKRIIEIAAAQGMRFVVIHPGSRLVQHIERGRVKVGAAATPMPTARQLMVEQVAHLVSYGRRLGVEVWIENLPGRECAAYTPFDRKRSVDVGFMPWESLTTLGERDIGLCLDLGHLYAEIMVHEPPGATAFAHLMDATRSLAPYVRHLHLSTIAPPWNGTDSHHGFLPTDYARGAVPGREQVLNWLRTFVGRDLCVVPEPAGGTEVHLANYRQLSAWMEELR